MVTIKDVAKEAGLAVSTVSRIMNNRGYISEDARRRVDEAMAKLNYQPNEMARSLQRKNSNIIGLIVPRIDHPYFAKVISCIEEEAYKHDYSVIIFNTQTKQQKQQASVDVCRQNRVAGIVMCTGILSVKGIEDMGIPVVGWERFVDSSSPVVECDNVQGGMLGAQHLIDVGCKHLMYLGTTTNMQMPGDFRYVGFKTACERAGMDFVSRTRPFDELPDSGYHDLTEDIIGLLKQYPETDGIMADSDTRAAQVLRACSELNISVPEQMKVVGYDDAIFSSQTNPPLTTIHQPVEEMAAHALDQIDRMISEDVVAKRVIFPVHLVIRESTVK